MVPEKRKNKGQFKGIQDIHKICPDTAQLNIAIFNVLIHFIIFHSFNEMQFKKPIHPLTLHHSVVSVHHRVVKHGHNFRTPSSLQKKKSCRSQHPLSLRPNLWWPLINTPVCMDSPFLDALHKQNHTICGRWYLAFH